ncbi:uncharacterized protein LOC144038170 [Vanacampus margaritifer]
MDEDGGEPKTYVSTVRLLLRGSARGKADPLAHGTGMTNTAGFSRPTGEKVHPLQNQSNVINGVARDATTLICDNSSGSQSRSVDIHFKEQKPSCSPDAMEVTAENTPASGKDGGCRTEAEAGT